MDKRDWLNMYTTIFYVLSHEHVTIETSAEYTEDQWHNLDAQ